MSQSGVTENTHTNKRKRHIQDPIRQKIIEMLMKKMTDRDDSSSSNDLSRDEINRMILKETLLLRPFGLGRSPPNFDGASSSTFHREPELLEEIEKLNKQLKEKDSRFKQLEKQNSETRQELSSIKDFMQKQFPSSFPPS
ncbi:hypothetical protein EUTSA_v10001066mg [Eutrema salsugineum]|uniref:Uncharacterized protein n=2 Tax=Eutrema salsugineum TaxID=72664 RepID=V4N3E6_EUTSA|nr:hypothetical protein EUTSA_v10001066mg [Eutrema salsugineum]